MATAEQTKCIIPGCGRKRVAKGMCRTHRERVRQFGDPLPDIPIRVRGSGQCTVTDCDRPVVGWGLCQPHYQRQRIHGEVMPDVPIIARGRRLCSVNSCDRIVTSGEWCDTHYTRWKRYGTVDADRPVQYKFKGHVPDGFHWCGRCQTLKLVGEFKPSKHTSSGLTGRCATCTLDGSLILMYNITLDDYNQMLKMQNGVCATCHKPETSIDSRNGVVLRLAVDHDHDCCPGQKSCGLCVRGLLCAACNRTLGLLDDDPGTLLRMAAYLHKDRLNAGSKLST